MIYVLFNTLSSMPVPITRQEAAELIDLPWPVNPYHLAAVVDTDSLEGAYALTQRTESVRLPGLLVAHDLGRSSQLGDLFVDRQGCVFCLMDDEFVPIDRVMQLIQGRQAGDLSGYRILLKNF